MKAPDKIYLGIDDIESGYVYNLSLDNNGHPEYIRKDVFLEWAKECKSDVADDVSHGDAFACGYNCGMNELIDKLNEM